MQQLNSQVKAVCCAASTAHRSALNATPRLLTIMTCARRLFTTSLGVSLLLQGYIVGCGLSGCATSTLSFVAQLRADSSASSHAPKDVAPAAFSYFAASAGITGSCVLAFFLLIRLKYSRIKLGPYLASKQGRSIAGLGCMQVLSSAIYSSHGRMLPDCLPAS